MAIWIEPVYLQSKIIREVEDMNQKNQTCRRRNTLRVRDIHGVGVRDFHGGRIIKWLLTDKANNTSVNSVVVGN